MRNKKIYSSFLFLIFFSCNLFSSEGDLIYRQGRYSIYKKNLISYYNASPDLVVSTNNGDIKINLNAFGRRTIPQEKISSTIINEINADSIEISFTTSDTSLPVKEEFISLNVTHAIDSILAIKK